MGFSLNKKSVLLLLAAAVIPSLLTASQYEWDTVGKFWSFLNTQFSVGILSAFIGTAAAAGIIFYLSEQVKKRELLAAINMSIALMAAHINTLLNFKVQILLPLSEEKKFIDTFATYCLETIRLNPGISPEKPINLPVPQIKKLMQTVQHPSLEFLVAIEKLSPFAERFPDAIVLAVKAKESMDSLQLMLDTWRELVVEMRNYQLSGEAGSLLRFFGYQRVGDIVDTRVPDTIDNLLKEADASLFYLRKTIEHLQEKSKNLLPEKVLKTLAKTSTKDGYEVFMPPRDLIKGWEDD